MKKPYESPRVEPIHLADAGELYTEEKIDKRTTEGKSKETARKLMEFAYSEGITPLKKRPISELPHFIRNMVYPSTLAEVPGHTKTWRLEEVFPKMKKEAAEDRYTALRIVFWDEEDATGITKIFDLWEFDVTSPLQWAKADAVTAERLEQEGHRREQFVDFAGAHTNERISGTVWKQIDEYLRYGFFVRLGELPDDGYAIISPLPENGNGFDVRLYDADGALIDGGELDFDTPSWE